MTTPQQAQPAGEPIYQGAPGECAYNRACMYHCGRQNPPAVPPEPLQAAAQPVPAIAPDLELSALAYTGFNEYWTEDCKGIDAEAWAACAKAIIKHRDAQWAVAPPTGESTTPAAPADELLRAFADHCGEYCDHTPESFRSGLMRLAAKARVYLNALAAPTAAAPTEPTSAQPAVAGEVPPLPDMKFIGIARDGAAFYGYTADQMRERDAMWMARLRAATTTPQAHQPQAGEGVGK